MRNIGTVKYLDVDGFTKFIKETDKQERISKYWNPKTCVFGAENSLYGLVRKYSEDKKLNSAFSNNVVTDYVYCNIAPDVGQKYINLYLKNKTNIHYVYRTDYYTVISFSGVYYLWLSEFVSVEPFKNADNLSYSEISGFVKNETNVQTALSTTHGLFTLNGVNSALNKTDEEVEKLQAEQKQELDKFIEKQRRELEEYKLALKAKQEELELRKEKLLDDVYIIESNVMNMRICLGEAIEHKVIRTGNRCNVETPLVVYQKMRYLEEEIVKLSITTADLFSDNHEQIEKAIFGNNVLLNTLCPAMKCVTVCKITRNNMYIAHGADGSFENLKLLHGNQLCVLIRDNECVDVVWIDDDLTLDDNLFITDKTQVDSSEVFLENTKLRSKAVNNAVVRSQIFLVIAKCVKSGIIKFPLEIDVTKPSKYVVFSSADNAITENKYPSLEQYLRECNKYERCEVGDLLYVFQNIAGSVFTQKGYHREYSSYRGRGSKDKAMDAYIHAGFNKISLKECVQTFYGEERKIYVKCEKAFSNKSKVNLYLEKYEFINLTFISSNHVQYWIDTRKIDGFDFSYAQIITFLSEILREIRLRETVEFGIIERYGEIPQTPENIDILTQWKYDNNIHGITEKTAKKFIQYFNAR